MDIEQLTRFLSDLVRYNTSINPAKGVFPDDECAKYLKNHAKSHGYDIIEVENCYYHNEKDKPLFPVVVVKRGTEPGLTVLFLGHIDVVPVTEAEKPDWVYDPFQPTVVDGKLHGRGAADMKGGVSAFFAAFDDLVPKAGNLVIALSGDEEIGGLDTMPKMIAALEEETLLPDFVINAEGSGTPVIVTKRRGGTQVSFTFELDQDIVLGNQTSKIFNSRLGDGGQSLHSMSFVLGSDTHAMITAGKFSMDLPVVHVESSSVKTNSVPKQVTLTYVERGGDDEIVYSSGLTKLMHALSSIGSIPLPITKSKYGPAINPNLLDIDEEEGTATITFDIRAMLVDNEHDKVVDIIKTHFNKFDLKTTADLQLAIDPVNVSPDHELAVTTQQMAESHDMQILTRGEKLGGASDTRFFTSLKIPGIELGPIGQNIHGMNEAVELDTIMKLKLIYRDLFYELTTSMV